MKNSIVVVFIGCNVHRKRIHFDYVDNFTITPMKYIFFLTLLYWFIKKNDKK